MWKVPELGTVTQLSFLETDLFLVLIHIFPAAEEGLRCELSLPGGIASASLLGEWACSSREDWDGRTRGQDLD